MNRAIAAALLLLGAACAPRSTPQPAPATARNLVVVTIDTLRADRVGAYGATTVATPNLDRLAREGAHALQATVPVPLTRPSHISFFTGLYPAEHGIRDNVSPPLASDVPVLAELLQNRGFTTAAFVSSMSGSPCSSALALSRRSSSLSPLRMDARRRKMTLSG